jgi:vancomycin resistance protein YoaR
MKLISLPSLALYSAAFLLVTMPLPSNAAPRLAQTDDENVIIDADHPEAAMPPKESMRPAKPQTAPAAKKVTPRASSQAAVINADGALPPAGALPQNSAPGFEEPIITAPATQGGRVGGIALNGEGDAKNIARLRAALADRLNAPVTLWDGRNRWTATRAGLGASIPFEVLVREARRSGSAVPLSFSVDEAKLRATMTRLAAKIEARPALQNVAATERVQVALAASMLRVRRALQNTPPQDYAEIVVTRTPLTANPGAKSLGGTAAFPYVLATFSTPYDAGIRGRTNNLRMAARLVNGTIVKPGETFSANRAIGPRNAAAGWREAKMFLNGQIVSGIGSGICQCSSTIYNAALLANLPILERHPHTFRVSYAAPSRDAAIYWGQKDMRFVNNTGGSILVETKLRSGRFHVRLLGTQPNTANVEVQSHVISRRGGTRSEAFRIVQTPTGAERVRLSRDFYRPHP